jgi:hypothetical protein
MFKKIGFGIIGILFLGVYGAIASKVFSGSDQQIHYAQNELMFGSYTLLGGFIFMTIILLIVCNYLIDLLFKRKHKKE